MSMVTPLKLYTLVRNDLGKSYAAVQASHAVAEFLLRGPKTEWDNGTMVLLGVKDKQELEKWTKKLTYKGIAWVGFKEPDLEGCQLTAISAVGTGEVFKNLNLF